MPSRSQVQNAEDEVRQLLAVIADPTSSQSERLQGRITLCERALTSCDQMLGIYQNEQDSGQRAASIALWKEAKASALAELEEARRELVKVTA